jgi:hypothetical protein
VTLWIVDLIELGTAGASVLAYAVRSPASLTCSDVVEKPPDSCAPSSHDRRRHQTGAGPSAWSVDRAASIWASVGANCARKAASER